MVRLPNVVMLGVAGCLAASSALAASVNLTPQAPAWAGFVTNSGAKYLDEIATGGLFFALGEPTGRGFARFDTSVIPAGSTINSVRLVSWASNHDLSGRAPCPKPYTLGDADFDPLTEPGVNMFNFMGTAAVYYSGVLNRTGPLFCLDSFIELDHDLGAQAVADLEARLPNGYFTVNIQSGTPCDVAQDHVDWVGYSESLMTPDASCTVLTLPGSRIELVVDYTPINDPCNVPAIAPIADLLAVKSPDGLDVEMVWAGDIEADAYNVWFVDTKEQLPSARSGGSGLNPPLCGPAAAPSCVHGGAVPDLPEGPRLFYQVRGTCGGSEAAE